ncbi:MAG TPA: hypothetical protein PKW41_05525 [Clostridia bacterium]|mgnify:CR=1 FL=1|nr:hypothetical protein [Clostridia bacterium]
MAKFGAASGKIHVAFRFHTNLYHSYRPDTLDEDGIGKDIRLIRYILDVLDAYNAGGVPVRGTWDIENHFSLGGNMRLFCPELIERIKKRVADGTDEMELMSFNNGIVSAHTAEEFRRNIAWSISNEWGSGVKDVFGTYAPVVRPQECMTTPGLIPLYKELGIEAISIYYSCISFNGFGCFVPKLSVKERFNPLWYGAPGRNERIALLPAINPGDSLDHLGMLNLVKSLRREQARMDEPCDLLVLLDMDADDDYWQGLVNVNLSRALGFKKPLIRGGLNAIVRQLSKLAYVEFDTPYRYLQTHPPLGEAIFGQDTADGSFDGYAPWADKLENTKLWTGIERERLAGEYALCAAGGRGSVKERLDGLMRDRLAAFSTTHFGLSTPVMCKPRLMQAAALAEGNLERAQAILGDAGPLSGSDGARALIPRRYYRGNGKKRGLIRLRDAGPNLTGEGVRFSFAREVFGMPERDLVYEGEGFEIALRRGAAAGAATSVYCDEGGIGNGEIALRLTDGGLALFHNGRRVTAQGSFATSVRYGGRVLSCGKPAFVTDRADANAAVLTETGAIYLGRKKERAVEYVKKYWIVGDLPYLYVDADIRYPMTEDRGMQAGKARRLRRGYDARWREVMPLEISPAFTGSDAEPVCVYKHNFLGDLSGFDFGFAALSGNPDIDASNNAITCAFVAFGAGDRGLLIAQSAAADTSFAFMRMRVRRTGGGRYALWLNPFGVYGGRPLRHPTLRHGFTDVISNAVGESFQSCAPTFRGGRQQFSLMLAPYGGGMPGDALVNDALLHAYPPYIQSDRNDVEMIPFAAWKNFGDVGE